MSSSIVVGGSLAQRPYYGGHTWVFLQYLLGFRRLGYEVLFVDRLDDSMCLDEQGHRCSLQKSVSLRYFLDVVREFGLENSFSLLYDKGRRTVGLDRTAVLDQVKRSAVFLNVMGYVEDEEILAAAHRRVFLDIDPGFGQMWRELGLHDPFTGHDDYVTIGENVGRPHCIIPTGGIPWRITRQPVVLDQWPDQSPGGNATTCIGSWRGPFGPIDYEGVTYGLRVHEFRKLADLPRRTGFHFEAALDMDPADASDAETLRRGGWVLVDPRAVAGDPAAYRRYIQSSRAEIMVAKNMYVRSQSGWFSDRSICYLASGKPVLAQDTGLADAYPLGEGLLTFSTPEEAEAGIREIHADYPRHAKAARRLAEEYFDSDKVLGNLLTGLGVE